jgi:hypothetical protein
LNNEKKEQKYLTSFEIYAKIIYEKYSHEEDSIDEIQKQFLK